jgi:hypothetical protein
LPDALWLIDTSEIRPDGGVNRNAPADGPHRRVPEPRRGLAWPSYRPSRAPGIAREHVTVWVTSNFQNAELRIYERPAGD